MNITISCMFLKKKTITRIAPAKPDRRLISLHQKSKIDLHHALLSKSNACILKLTYSQTQWAVGDINQLVNTLAWG